MVKKELAGKRACGTDSEVQLNFPWFSAATVPSSGLGGRIAVSEQLKRP